MAICALCGEDKPLCKSHYLPAAFFRRMHVKVGGKVLPPVSLSKDRAFFHGKQVAANLLCSQCEKRLKNGGEDWAIACSAKESGFFRLRHLLLQTIPDGSISRGQVYFANMLPKLQHNKLVYFAASVFWRGSVLDWKLVDKNVDQICLPDTLGEQLRTFLLGLSAFPVNRALTIEVAMKPFRGMSFPKLIEPIQDKLNAQPLGYGFYLFGITFYLIFPDSLNGVPVSKMSIAEHPNPLILTDAMPTRFEERAHEFAKSARRIGRLSATSP